MTKSTSVAGANNFAFTLVCTRVGLQVNNAQSSISNRITETAAACLLANVFKHWCMFRLGRHSSGSAEALQPREESNKRIKRVAVLRS